jgi:hypothetical protein
MIHRAIARDKILYTFIESPSESKLLLKDDSWYVIIVMMGNDRISVKKDSKEECVALINSLSLLLV